MVFMEEMKRLAYDYFAGKISKEDEVTLKDYIQEPAHMEEFRTWEREWLLSADHHQISQMAWEKCRARIKSQSVRSRRLYYSWAAAVAAVVVVVMISVFWGKQMKENTVGMPAEFYVISTLKGEKKQVRLNDGTSIMINADSEIECSNRFNVSDRRVALKGEAYFDVTHHEQLPFVVELSEDCSVKVLGTRFNVFAYDEVLRVTLFEGSVEMTTPLGVEVLKPGQTFVYDASKHLSIINEANEEQVSAWTEGRLAFERISLQELFVYLERQYDVKLEMDSSQLPLNDAISISLRNGEQFEDVAYALETILDIKLTKMSDNVYRIGINNKR